jgi:hypothetical protein
MRRVVAGIAGETNGKGPTEIGYKCQVFTDKNLTLVADLRPNPQIPPVSQLGLREQLEGATALALMNDL